jgi:hypothetical protein
MNLSKYTAPIVGFVAIALSGCTANPPKLTQELQSELDTPLYCESDEECKTMWERAAYFVNSNAGFKLQIHNDTIIETYNPTKYSPRLAFSVSKEPKGNGKYQIRVKAWCANMFGCQPNQYEAIARVKKYMRTGVN